MAILVIAEHDNSSIKAATLNAVTAATRIGAELHLLVAGSGCAAAADAAAKIAGVGKVLLADAPQYADQSPENLAALVVANAAAYGHIVTAATTIGKNFMPRVAALLDVAQISEIVAVEAPDTFVRPIYAGNVLATVQSSDAVKVLTVRTTAFEAAGEGGSAAVESLAAGPDLAQSKLINRELTKSERPELSAAKSSSPAVAAWLTATIFTNCSSRWPTGWALRWVPRGRQSMPATLPTTTRSARPARSLRRSCTSPSASRVRFSIWPE
jgi:electron transfer flavoprotein alpha subunit